MKQEKNQKVNVRAAAYNELLRFEQSGTFINIAVDTAIRRHGFSGHDRDFFTALVYGVTERQITLDYYISKLSSKPIRKLDPEVVVALRIGLYQIIYMDKIPDSAACNESVKLVKKLAASAAPFVNAILRAFLRKREELVFPSAEKEPVKYLSVRYSVSEKLCGLWCEMYGYGQTERILRGMDEPPTVTLRVNTLKTDRETLLGKLAADGIEAVPSPEAKFGIRICCSVPVGSLDVLADGSCTVQDDASSLSVEALDPRPGDTVIDMCSAPGGKSMSAAMLMGGEGRIRSFDIYESKLELIRGSAERLGIGIIETECSDGAVFREELAQTADRVICDVPCSGYGVLAKKPDLRSRAAARVSDSELPELQYKILCNAAAYLKKGGRLLYSTCTLCRSENEDNVARFIAEHDGYTVRIERTLFPDPELPLYLRTDGFYFAVIEKH